MTTVATIWHNFASKTVNSSAIHTLSLVLNLTCDVILFVGEGLVSKPSHEMEENERHANGTRQGHGTTEARHVSDVTQHDVMRERHKDWKA